MKACFVAPPGCPGIAVPPGSAPAATGGFACCFISISIDSIVIFVHLFFCISRRRRLLAGRHSRASLLLSKALERASEGASEGLQENHALPLPSARASQQAKVTTGVPLKRFNQARGKRAKTHTYLTRVFTVIT